MKAILKLLTSLGGDFYVTTGNRENNRTKEGKLCTLTLIQNWLIEQHEILVFIQPAVTKNGTVYKFIMVDARTRFYNKKVDSKYMFDSYSRALEVGVWSALTYLQ